MELSSETIKKIKKNKKRLENKLKIKIEINQNNINLEGNGLDIYAGERVLEAINKDFPVSAALLLADEEYTLEDIQIKNITKKKNLIPVRARIIGTKGKTLKTLSELTSCHISLHDNIVSIIGPSDKIKETTTAIKNLIRGRKQANVYSYLEKYREKELLGDLGLKE